MGLGTFYTKLMVFCTELKSHAPKGSCVVADGPQLSEEEGARVPQVFLRSSYSAWCAQVRRVQFYLAPCTLITKSGMWNLSFALLILFIDGSKKISLNFY